MRQCTNESDDSEIRALRKIVRNAQCVLDVAKSNKRHVKDQNMTEVEFQSLANEGFNRIPLIAEALADLETPLSLYLKLAQTERNGANSFLLESVVGGERFGRYSFIGLPARTLLRTRHAAGNGITEVVSD